MSAGVREPDQTVNLAFNNLVGANPTSPTRNWGTNMKYIFDVDGTLTPSRQRVDYKFGEFLLEFFERNECYIVTGSDKSKTVEQLGEEIYNAAKRSYNCSGNQVYEGERLVRENHWSLANNEYEYLVHELNASGFPMRAGLHIEDRPGMVNFSIVGRKATLGERVLYKKYDKKHQEREQIAKRFREKFPHLECHVAGETGMDIFPVGMDKGQVIKDFYLDNKLKFYGDMMQPGGNDYPLRVKLEEVGGQWVEVQDWKETYKLLVLDDSGIV